MNWLRTLFGGSFGTVQAVLVFALVTGGTWLWADYRATKRDNERLEREATVAKLDAFFANASAWAVATTTERRAEDQAEQLTLEDIINAMPKTNHCASAPAVRAALDGLRERRGLVLPPDRAGTDVPVQPLAGGPDR